MNRKCCFAWVPLCATAVTGMQAPARAQCSPQEVQKLTASDAAPGARFGAAVSLSGDTALVGAPSSNAAYAFVRSGGVWIEQQKLTGTGAVPTAQVGFAVAVDGDTAVVGAPIDTASSVSLAGSAYVFVRSAGVWTQQAKLTAAVPVANAAFGCSVAISGDTIVVGAAEQFPIGGGTTVGPGAVYVFTRSGTVWSLQAKLTAADGASGDTLGCSVAISGDSVAAGAFQDQVGADMFAGSVYVFVKPGGGWVNMTQTAKLTAGGLGLAGSFLGFSVALSGDTIVAGADRFGGNAGRVYVFVKPGGGWVNMTQTVSFGATDWQPSSQFGNAVSIDGDTICVAAFVDDAVTINGGATYVFRGAGANWQQAGKLTPIDLAFLDLFGFAVAVRGDTIIVGSRDDDDAGTSSGSAYIFSISQADSDGDGVCDADDVCPNNAPDLPVDGAGRPLRDANEDCLLDAEDIQIIVSELLNQ